MDGNPQTSTNLKKDINVKINIIDMSTEFKSHYIFIYDFIFFFFLISLNLRRHKTYIEKIYILKT